MPTRTNGRHPSAPVKKPTSNNRLAERLDDLERRVVDIEKIVSTARLKQQRELAKKLAEDPEKLAQMREVLALAEEGET